MAVAKKNLALVAAAAALALARLAPEYLITSSVWVTGAVLLGVQLMALFSWSTFLYPHLFSPLRHLPQPKGNSILMGHLPRIRKDPTGEPHRAWANEIPNDGIIRYLGPFNEERLLLVSPKAVGEALVTKSYDFVKPPALADSIGRILGIGILFAEGDEHRRQRRNLTPAFTYRHIKNLYPVFWGKTVETVLAIDDEIAKPAPAATPEGQHKVKPSDVIQVDEWASRSTLDIIGVAGFDKSFNAIQNPQSQLFVVYNKLFKPNRMARFLGVLSIFLPFWLLRVLPVKRNSDVHNASVYIRDVCRDMIKVKKAQLAAAEGKAGGKDVADAAIGVDILSVALRSGGFSDEDLVDQMMTFLAAGHETTASAMTWALLHLCRNQDVQDRLRSELKAAGIPSARDSNAGVTAEQLDKVQYLQAVCNETLRYTPPVPLTMRVAGCNTSIQGQYVPKGTVIIIAPNGTNRTQQAWGQDADSFNPERWMGKNANSGGADSNYSFLTFLHGPRSCIGQSFSRAEFACLLAGWVMSYSTALEKPDQEFDVAGGITQRIKGGLSVRLTPVN